MKTPFTLQPYQLAILDGLEKRRMEDFIKEVSRLTEEQLRHMILLMAVQDFTGREG